MLLKFGRMLNEHQTRGAFGHTLQTAGPHITFNTALIYCGLWRTN